MSHLFSIGTLVTCDVVSSGGPGRPTSFTVEALMPPVGTSLQYRIKSEAESFRRVASEHQLSAAGFVKPAAVIPARSSGEQD